jgi:hypothetical protein
MANEIEINDTHLVVLKKYPHEKGVSIDYIPFANPMRSLLDRAYKKCSDELSHKEYPNEILDSDQNLRNIFLIDYDFCSQLERPFQELGDLSDYRYEYDSDLSPKEIKKQVLKDKKDLMYELKLRDKAYALKLAYEKAKDDSNIVSMSHRRIGWTDAPFSTTKNLDVQFKTNFGYGKSSYFYAKLRFKEIDIIPFSEWVIYRYINYRQIMHYSQSYNNLENEDWITAMEYVRDAINLCEEDELKFIEKYIVTECQWLIKGLKDICNVEKPIDKYSKEMIEIRARMDYKGEKLSGSLNFISSIAEYESITSVNKFINDLEQLCEDELPILLRDHGEIIDDLNKANKSLTIEKPKYEKIQDKYGGIRKKFLPLEKLHERISIYGIIKNPDTPKNLQKLFEIKYHDFGEIKAQYLEIKAEYKKIEKKYLEILELIRRLRQYDRNFERYIDKIDNHLQLYIKNYKSVVQHKKLESI